VSSVPSPKGSRAGASTATCSRAPETFRWMPIARFVSRNLGSATVRATVAANSFEGSRRPGQRTYLDCAQFKLTVTDLCLR